MKRRLLTAALAAACTLAFAQSGVVNAQGGPPQQKSQQRDRMYGYGMMSDAERKEYREKMRGAQTADERRKLRDEHRKVMDERMKERGIEPGPHAGGGPRGPGPRGPAPSQTPK